MEIKAQLLGDFAKFTNNICPSGVAIFEHFVGYSYVKTVKQNVLTKALKDRNIPCVWLPKTFASKYRTEMVRLNADLLIVFLISFNGLLYEDKGRHVNVAIFNRREDLECNFLSFSFK